MNYTTIEQSQKLIKWGINPKIADLHFFIEPSKTEKVDFGYSEENEKFYRETQFKYLPCFSLTCLWDIMPKVNGEFPQFIKVETQRNKQIGYLVYFEDNEHHKNFNSGVQPTAIEAAIQMIKLLLNYGYLKRV